MIETFFEIAAITRPTAEIAAHRTYGPNVGDDEALKDLIKGLLLVFRPVAGACFMMNALLAAGIRKRLSVPVAVVVGDLYVGPHQVFITQPNQDWSEIGRSSGTVEGHAWIQIGKRTIEVSIFRTVGLGGVSPEVKKIIHDRLGEQRGAALGEFPVVDPFYFQPRYVMTQDQEDILAASAYSQFVAPTSDGG